VLSQLPPLLLLCNTYRSVNVYYCAGADGDDSSPVQLLTLPDTLQYLAAHSQAVAGSSVNSVTVLGGCLGGALRVVRFQHDHSSSSSSSDGDDSSSGGSSSAVAVCEVSCVRSISNSS
jgi:hypothetical protein